MDVFERQTCSFGNVTSMSVPTHEAEKIDCTKLETIYLSPHHLGQSIIVVVANQSKSHLVLKNSHVLTSLLFFHFGDGRLMAIISKRFYD
jgi:hypothetical protein